MKKFKNKNLTASSKNWIARQFSDPYTKLAKQKGYRSRSVFKLIEINDKFKFLKNNLNILDLGSAPGGWSQVCAEINKNGKNLSIDILNMPIRSLKISILQVEQLADNLLIYS